MKLFSNWVAEPKLSKDLARQRISSLPIAKGSLFYLMRPFLAFKTPDVSRLNRFDYQSNLALFEMSFVMLARTEVSAVTIKSLRDTLWPEILRAHIDLFASYLGISPTDTSFEDVWSERRRIYAALGGLTSLDDYMKGFSWTLHESLDAGAPTLGMHGMVETMLFGKTDKGLKVSYLPPLELELGAGFMKIIYDGPLEKHAFNFLDHANRGCLDTFLRDMA